MVDHLKINICFHDLQSIESPPPAESSEIEVPHHWVSLYLNIMYLFKLFLLNYQGRETNLL